MGEKPEILTRFKFLIFIFPVLYLLWGFYFRQIFGDLSLRSNDPDYIHFISGMCIATGQFGQANVDHPGSVLQLLLAIVFRVIYFFRKGDLPFFEDAMLNSDLYLSVGNLVITVVLSLTLLWAGKSVLALTNNVFYAFLVQIGPFLIPMWSDIIGRIYPELLFVVPVLILQVKFLEMIYQKTDGSSWKDILTISFAIAMGMALKMTFLPFVFLVFVVIKSWKKKLIALGCVVIFFLLLALPVTFQINRFWHWMSGIFVHSGSYQGGSNNVLNISLFLNNFWMLLRNEKIFFIAMVFMFVGFIGLLVRKKLKGDRDVLIRISLGLLLVLIGITFIVSKQYAVRYFLPALLLLPFLFILVVEYISVFINVKRLSFALSVFVFCIGLFKISDAVPKMRTVSKVVGCQMAAREETRNYVSALEKDSYKIIVSQDYGCPFHEYCIMYSFCVAGHNWPQYQEKLDKIYPNTYQYFTWDNSIKYWGKELTVDEIINSGKPLYLYLEKDTDELYEKTIKKIDEGGKYVFEKREIFVNPNNNEAIYQMIINKI
jgi:hypothetical protein